MNTLNYDDWDIRISNRVWQSCDSDILAEWYIPNIWIYTTVIKLISAFFNTIGISVIVKKSSPKNLSADSRPTVARLSADSWPTVARLSADSWPTVARLLADSCPFVGCWRVCLPSAGVAVVMRVGLLVARVGLCVVPPLGVLRWPSLRLRGASRGF